VATARETVDSILEALSKIRKTDFPIDDFQDDLRQVDEDLWAIVDELGV
jgi:hypothetical protein